MCDVPVFYATSEGQTRRIAERLAQRLRELGVWSVAIEVTSPESAAYDWRRAHGAILGASLHAGTHQRDAITFARTHHLALNGLPSVFFSVSLAAASNRAAEREAAAGLARKFVQDAGWVPWRIECVAGRLAYTQYGFFTRWFMKRIAKKEQGPIDTSRDHELTDWAAVDALAAAFAREIRRVRALEGGHHYAIA